MKKPTLPAPTFRELVVRLLILGTIAGLIMVRGFSPSDGDGEPQIASAVSTAVSGLLYRP